MSPEPTLCGRSPRAILPVLIFLSILLCLGVGPVFAASFNVTSTADDGGLGTLRAGVDDNDVDSITFNVTGTITLNSSYGPLIINRTLTITGPSGGISIKGNALSGVIQVSAGTVKLEKLTLTGGQTSLNGGGLYVSGGEVTLKQCTISGNSASFGNGGGIYSTGAISMTNCTVSGNTASGSGGGIYNNSLNPSLVNCTITQNTASNGGGYYEGRAGTGEGARILNSIISNNTASSDSSIANPSVNVTSLGNNLVGNNPTGTPFSTSNGDIISNAPGLDSLASNGGPTQTHALLSSSAAVDTGTNSGAPIVDQRDISRPQDGNGDGTAITDIGAYEFVPSAGASNTPPAANAQYVSLSKTGNKTVGITLSGSDQEGDTLTYSVVQNPSVGTLSGTPPNMTYTWNGGNTYLDSFTFRAYDGYHYSAPATVKIEAVESPSNMPAVAHNKVVSTPSGSSKSIVLSGSDFEGAPLSYEISTQPSHGTLSGTAPNKTYTPNPSYSGADVFYYKAKDGNTAIPRDSEPAWVYIYVGILSVPSLPPAADAGPDKTAQYSATLDGSRSFDPTGRTLTYSWSGSSDLTFGSPSLNTTTVDKSSRGIATYPVTLTVTNTDSQSASDTVQYVRTPGYDHLTMILLALFWAFLGVRYIRKGTAPKR